MKKFLLFAVAALVAGTVSAQTLRFVDEEGNEYANNASIVTYDVEPEMFNLVWHLNVKNTSGSDATFIVAHEVEEINGFIQFCGNAEVTTPQCYGASAVGLSEYGPYTLAGNTSAYCFHAAMMMLTDDTKARVKYTVYLEENPEDAAVITVTYTKENYDKGLASVDKTFAGSTVNVFQRGGNLVCNYNFDTDASRSIAVYNIVGARVATLPLEGNNGEVAFNTLPKGVYVYTLLENGRNVKSQKVVVR